MKYPKINTLFKRDEYNIIIPSMFTKEEFEYLKDLPFECTEKIDGTNIRIYLKGTIENPVIEIKGREEKSDIPKHLLEKLNEMFNIATLVEVFKDSIGEDGEFNVTLYGEGYGKKIQKCGSRYLSNDVNFILFDVRIGDWWLKLYDVNKIAASLSIQSVPFVGNLTINQAIQYVKEGFISAISEDRTLLAEGLVLKTPCGLRFRSGERITTKLKTGDFYKFKARYGNEENPIQHVNPMYKEV